MYEIERYGLSAEQDEEDRSAVRVSCSALGEFICKLYTLTLVKNYAKTFVKQLFIV